MALAEQIARALNSPKKGSGRGAFNLAIAHAAGPLVTTGLLLFRYRLCLL
jgi:hypothetical protein